MRAVSRFLLVSTVVAVAALALARGRGQAAGAPTALPAPALADGNALSAGIDTAVFAGGCFWGVEAVFEHVRGVKSAVSGYAGGETRNPSYEDVGSGNTGHAESVRVVYDRGEVGYGDLLRVFFSVAHDPTQLNRQGPDEGTQYRSAIFFRTDSQRVAAQSYIAQLTAAKAFARPIVTEVAPLGAFYEAEDYHQDFLAHHPTNSYIVINDAPKVANLKRLFPDLYRD